MSKQGTRQKSADSATRKAARKAARDKMAVEVGERLILLRLALAHLGLAPKTQKAFAKEVGIGQTSYNQYETGETMLTPAAAVKLYKRFGTTLNWIYADRIGELPTRLHQAIMEERAKRR